MLNNAVEERSTKWNQAGRMLKRPLLTSSINRKEPKIMRYKGRPWEITGEMNSERKRKG